MITWPNLYDGIVWFCGNGCRGVLVMEAEADYPIKPQLNPKTRPNWS